MTIEERDELRELMVELRAKKGFKEYIGISVTIAGWVISIAYFTGSFGERIRTLEDQQKQLSISIASFMQVAVAQEKFNNVQQQLNAQEKHLENTDKLLEDMRRKHAEY